MYPAPPPIPPLAHRAILGVRVDGTSYGDACDRLHGWITQQQWGYVVAANVHVIMTAQQSPAYREVLKHAALVTPDGMPLVWAMRLLGLTEQTRVYGPDLMGFWCERSSRLGVPLYLYGGTPAMVAKLLDILPQRYPGLVIAGSYSPPFRPPSAAEDEDDRNRIHASGAQVVLVALGCPKQEYWMARQAPHLKAMAIGVGAAFSFYSGSVSQAPRWLMGLGLEWLYRFSQEPGRLWQRYLLNNPLFVIRFSGQLLRQTFQKIRTKKS